MQSYKKQVNPYTSIYVFQARDKKKQKNGKTLKIRFNHVCAGHFLSPPHTPSTKIGPNKYLMFSEDLKRRCFW